MNNYDVCLIIKNHSIARQLLSSFENKAIISHLIDRFPLNSKIIFSMAEGTSLLQQYIKMIYPQDRFVIVKDHGYSELEDQERKLLLNCKDFLSQSFLLIQDPIWWQSKITTRENWMAVSAQPKRTESIYQSVSVSSDFQIHSFNQKNNENSIFLGMSYILDHHLFWPIIENKKTLLRGLEEFIQKYKVFAHFFSGWQELTKLTHESEELLCLKNQIEKKQINVYLKATDCLKVIKKHDRFPKIFPEIKQCSLNALTFSLPKGVCLKTYLSPAILIEFCTYLENHLWKTPSFDESCSVQDDSMDFYQDLHRSIQGKLRLTKKPLRIRKEKNEMDQSDLENLLMKVNWNRMSGSIPAFIHGNLCLKNIFYQQEDQVFNLIDPTPNLNIAGDIYCDLAKVYSSLRYHFLLCSKQKS